jgi:hypothetical protein
LFCQHHNFFVQSVAEALCGEIDQTATDRCPLDLDGVFALRILTLRAVTYPARLAIRIAQLNLLTR